MAVGRSGDSPKGESLSVHDRGTLDALLAPIHRASTGLLATAMSFGDIGGETPIQEALERI